MTATTVRRAVSLGRHIGLPLLFDIPEPVASAHTKTGAGAFGLVGQLRIVDAKVSGTRARLDFLELRVSGYRSQGAIRILPD